MRGGGDGGENAVREDLASWVGSFEAASGVGDANELAKKNRHGLKKAHPAVLNKKGGGTCGACMGR